MVCLKSLVLLGLVGRVFAEVQFIGLAIAGGDFGCEIDGTCPPNSAHFPEDGADQMEHFVYDVGMNIFRLPTSWQYLVNNKVGASLDSTNLGKFDQLMQSCLDTGAYCMIDIHNYARWNGEIIGQGGPTDEQFVSFWSELATKYSAKEKIVFGLMNEPHHLDLDLWVKTCQKVVTGIRKTGATKQMILLPGTDFDNAASLVSSGSAAKLMAITNPDGTTDALILDVHKYLDVDNSGTHEECVTDNLPAFDSVATFLRANGRKGLVSETGASNAASCFTAFCAQNQFINQNSDVFLGLVGWGAGSFATSYVLSLTPTLKNGAYVDNDLFTKCVLAPWVKTGGTYTAKAHPAKTSKAAVGSATGSGSVTVAPGSNAARSSSFLGTVGGHPGSALSALALWLAVVVSLVGV